MPSSEAGFQLGALAQGAPLRVWSFPYGAGGNIGARKTFKAVHAIVAH